MRKFYLVALMALWAAVGQAQTLKIKVNGGSEQQGSSLENALSNAGYSSTNYSSITSLEVTGGDFTTADWHWMKGPKLTGLQNFTIQSTVASAADVPDNGIEVSTIFPSMGMKKVHLAKVSRLGGNAFMDISIEEVELPDVTVIGSFAFAKLGSSLSKISMPKVTTIGNNAFTRCVQLVSMAVGATPPTVESTSFAFFDNRERWLTLVDANGQPLTGDELASARKRYMNPANGGSGTNSLVVTWRNYWQFYPLYNVTYTIDGNGVIVDEYENDVTSYKISEGRDGTTVIARPNAGYVFLRWSDGTTATEHRALNVQSNITYTAYFGLPSVKKKLIYSAGPNGKVNNQSKIEEEVSPGDNGPEVTAQPNNGYKFLNWSDYNISNPRKDLNIQHDTTLTANFVLLTDQTYDLTYNAEANGYIDGEALQRVRAGGNGEYVTAKPNDANYKFVRWDDGNPNATRRDESVNENITVTAEFVSTGTTIYTLNYGVEGNGTISGYTMQKVAKGTNGVEVEVIPNTGHKFVRWSDGRTDNPRQDVSVQGDISVTAIVVLDNTDVFTLTYVVRNAGTGTISGLTTQTIERGGNGLQVQANPATGYKFLRWSDGSAQNPRQDANVQSNISVEAIFVDENITTYNLNYSVQNPGSGNISGFATQSVEPNGDGAPVEAIPADNYKFVRWSDNGSTSAQRQDKNVQSNIDAAAIMVTKNTNTYTLNYNVKGNGKINGLSTQTVEHNGHGLMVEAVANTGHKFVRWSDGRTDNPRQDVSVQGDISVTAIIVNQDVLTYTFTYTADANGSINGPTPQTVEQGGDGIAVTAAPKTNYKFLHWSDSTISNPRLDKNAQSDINVKAKFVSSSTDVHTLTYTASTDGSISGIAQQRVIKGGNGAKVTAIADDGYVFVSWSDGNPNAARWDTNVQDDITVTAVFVPKGTPIYTLTYSTSENQNGTKRGYITGYATQKVAQGGCGAKVIAKPNTDFNFNGWDDGNTEDSRKDCNVQSDINVTAKFIGTFCDKPELRKDSIVKACHEFWWDATRHYTTSGHKVINMIDEYEWNTLYEEWCPLAVDLHLTLEHRDTAYFTATASNSYTFRDTTITTPGSHVVDINIPNTRPGALCDSVVRIYLTIVKQNLTHAETANGVSKNIAIYPNPTSTGFYVETEATEVRVSSINGYLHLQQPVNGKTYVDISHLPSGVYIVRAGNAAARVVKI